MIFFIHVFALITIILGITAHYLLFSVTLILLLLMIKKHKLHPNYFLLVVYGVYIFQQHHTIPIKPNIAEPLMIQSHYTQNNQSISGEGYLGKIRVRYHYYLDNKQLPFNDIPAVCDITGELSEITPSRNFHQFDYQQYS